MQQILVDMAVLGFLLSRPVGPEEIPALLERVHAAFKAEPMESETLHLVERVGA